LAWHSPYSLRPRAAGCWRELFVVHGLQFFGQSRPGTHFPATLRRGLQLGFRDFLALWDVQIPVKLAAMTRLVDAGILNPVSHDSTPI